MKTLVLIGDSIRMGYQTTVREELQGLAEIWEPEANGGDSRNVLAHLDEWVLARRPDAVHINCGLHDIRRDIDSDARQVPLDEYERNVKDILQQIGAIPGTVVVWARTTPVNEDRHREVKGFDRFVADVTAYNAAADRVAHALGVPVNDLFGCIMDGGRDELLQPDGVHYTPAGSRRLGTAVATCLRPYLRT